MNERKGKRKIGNYPREIEEDESYWEMTEIVKKDLEEKGVKIDMNKIANVLNMTEGIIERKYWKSLELWEEFAEVQDELETVIKNRLLEMVDKLKMFDREEDPKSKERERKKQGVEKMNNMNE